MGTSPLPDVIARDKQQDFESLEWVGMEKIALPIQFEGQALTAWFDCFVDLHRGEKGIHMSRLYTLLNDKLAHQAINLNTLHQLLDDFLSSHTGISTNARITASFDFALNRPALKSQHYGYQAYPVVLSCEHKQGKRISKVELTVAYSSTCPCSAALARQLISQQLERDFSGDTIDKAELQTWLANKQVPLATPHNQRSYAYLRLQLKPYHELSLTSFINEIEACLGTPVQTAVKREDEQAFADLNGRNLMFCEDAARKLKRYLSRAQELSDYWYKVEHQESLHAHNAVVIDSKYPSHPLTNEESLC